MQVNFAAIRNDLCRLRECSPRSNVFGAETHQFQTNPPLSEGVVQEFEAKHKIALPSDYRGFLIHVGNGGAGPAYGLFPLGIEDSGTSQGPLPWHEKDGFVGVLAEPFPHTDPWNDLSGKPEFDGDREWEDSFEQERDAWHEVYWSTSNINGAIPICHLGCAYRQWLVVTGSEAGNVWDDDRANYGGLKPTQAGRRKRTTFIRWYRSWLDDALKQL